MPNVQRASGVISSHQQELTGTTRTPTGPSRASAHVSHRPMHQPNTVITRGLIGRHLVRIGCPQPCTRAHCIGLRELDHRGLICARVLGAAPLASRHPPASPCRTFQEVGGGGAFQ
jgi:hypothetical protein